MVYAIEIINCKGLYPWYYFNKSEFESQGLSVDDFKFLIYDSDLDISDVVTYDNLPEDLFGRFGDIIYTWSVEDFNVMDCLEFEEEELGVPDSLILDLFDDKHHLNIYNSFALVPSGEPVFTVPQLIRYLHQVRIGNMECSDAKYITKRLVSFRGGNEIVVSGVNASYVFRIKDMEKFKKCVA